MVMAAITSHNRIDACSSSQDAASSSGSHTMVNSSNSILDDGSRATSSTPDYPMTKNQQPQDFTILTDYSKRRASFSSGESSMGMNDDDGGTTSTTPLCLWTIDCRLRPGLLESDALNLWVERISIPQPVSCFDFSFQAK